MHGSASLSMEYVLLRFGVTTRNIAIECVISEAIFHKFHLKHYQQLFISFCPFQLLVAGLSAAVLHVELLQIIL
jgi:hypothetical protein